MHTLRDNEVASCKVSHRPDQVGRGPKLNRLAPVIKKGGGNAVQGLGKSLAEGPATRKVALWDKGLHATRHLSVNLCSLEVSAGQGPPLESRAVSNTKCD